MALSKNIALGNLIFDEKSLTQLLTILSSDYDPDAPRDSYQRYSLDISEDSETLMSVDQPPKSLAQFLENPVHDIRLRFEISRPKKNIEFKIENGSDSKYNNQITISSDNEEWVHGKHREVRRILESLDGHTAFFRKFDSFLSLTIMLFVAFLVYRIEWLIYVLFLPENWPDKSSFIQGLINGIAFVLPIPIGLIAASYLVDFFKSAYPMIEIKTGGPKHRIAERRRKRIKPIIGFLVVTPILTFLGDLWKYLLMGK